MATNLAWPGELDTAACHQRFRQLQELRITQGLDALIIAIGPDAAFSRANEAVFNWLLLGLSGREAYGSVSGRYEESLVCLSDRNWIFCKKADFEDLTLRTARWDATSLVAPPDADPDYYEDKKMGTFIEMVKDCRKLGVFVGKHELSQSSDLKMTVEKWPVVQAFGYDEFGLGFMTLHRELVNLEPKLSELFSTWDPPAVSWAQQTMLKLQKSWADALVFHDQHSREEALAAAPIVDYFIYGHLDDEVDRAISPCPRVLVGKQTSEILKDAIPGESMAQDDVNARHMIWEAVDPMTGVSMTRTYGLMTPFDAKMQDVLVAYAACCRCCRTFLLEKVAGAEATRRAAEIFQTAGLSQVPEIFDCGLDAFGAPVPGGGLRFLRLCCRLEDGSYVSYGDSSFDGSGVLLGESKETPSFAFWTAASEEGRSREIQHAFETAMGLKLDWGRSVALGHRKDVRVYLDPPEQPPDALNLGEEPLDTETFCELAVTFGDGSPGPVGFATGKCWTYASGKVVVSSGRSGYLLLTVQRRSLKSTLPAQKGQLWVAMDAQNSPSCLKIALSVSPDTLSSWHSRWASGDTTGDELGWLAPIMRGSLPATPPVGPPSTGRTQKQLLVTGLPGCAAIDVAHTLSRLLHAPFLDLEDGTSKPTDTPLDLSRLQELQGEEEWLVLCDVLRDPSTLQAQLPELRVLSILDPMLAYPWHSCRHPRLRGSVPNAAVVAVGRTGPKETQDQRALGTLLAKELQRSVGREVLLRPLTSDLVAAVQTAVPAIPDGAAVAVEGLPSFSRCFVPCGVLDLQQLRQRLMKCLEEAAEQCCKLPLAKVSPWKGLFAIEVKALVVDNSQDFWRSTDLSSDGTKNLVEKNLVFTQKGELPPRQHWQEPLASKCGALFWFCGSSPSSPALVSAEMAQCAVLEPQEEPLWLVDTVPEDVRSKLVKDLRSQGPPEGYSFDGNRYIHQEDYRTQKDHPHLAMRLQQLVSEQNATEQLRRQRAKEMLAVAPFTRPMSPSRPAVGGTRAPVGSRPPRLPRMAAVPGPGPAGYPQVD